MEKKHTCKNPLRNNESIPPESITKVAILGSDVNYDGKGWIPLNRDEYDGHDWEFHHINTVDFPNGNTAYCGRFYCIHNTRVISTFIYLPAKNLLCVTTQHTHINTGEQVQRIDIIERINDTDYWLYTPGSPVRVLAKIIK